MNITVLDSDSNDSDIFIVKQIKPVNKITLQEALLIKHNVLHLQQVKKNESSIHSKGKKISNAEHGEGKKLKKKEIKSPSQKQKDNKCISRKEKSVDGSLVKYFSQKSTEENEVQVSSEILKETEVEVVEILKENEKKESKNFDIFCKKEVSSSIASSEKRKSDNENIKLSPGIQRKRKKFKVLNEGSPNKSKSPSPKKSYNDAVKNLFNSEDEPPSREDELLGFKTEKYLDDIKQEVYQNSNSQVEEPSSSSQPKDLLRIIDSSSGLDEEKWKNNSELLCFCLKKIIRDEIRKQLDLEENAVHNCRQSEKLLSERECEILEKFLNLEDNACKLYVRMLCRKKYWHRVSTINYKDINVNLNREFELLNKENFVETNIWDEDLFTQLDLLSKMEIQLLCKTFNVPLKSNMSCKKNKLIINLINNTKNQKSVLDMLKAKGKSREDLLKNEIIKCLGMCAKLNEKALATFNKIMLLFSFPHYFDEENKRFSTQLFTCVRVYKNFIKYPKYKLSPTVVFQTCFDFEQYEKALALQEIFEEAITTKRYEDFETIKNKAKQQFNKLLENEEYKKRYSNLPSFLQKFSGGAVYARILTKYCVTFKKKIKTKEIISIIQLLMSQEYFLKGKKGKWCEILAQAYENIKNNNKAAEVLVKSLQDNHLDDVQKLTLQLRSQVLLKKKTNCVDGGNLREILDDLCTASVQEPPSIEIKGKALKGNERGSKCVYIEENGDGKLYASVEERAILHYKSIGYTKGFHTEGFIIHSLYFLLFFDIIYGVSPPGVFQSPYQDAPLDFNSKHFYLSRKEVIDGRLNEMCNWTEEELETKLRAVYYENFNTQCLISWSEDFTPEIFLEFIKCLTMPIFALICQRLVQNYRVFRSGFPDLSLWCPETKKCKFVEVKSPNDRLSPNQRVWLDFLRNIGVDCEVCNVKNIAFKTAS